jgi:hypothetical protein
LRLFRAHDGSQPRCLKPQYDSPHPLLNPSGWTAAPDFPSSLVLSSNPRCSLSSLHHDRPSLPPLPLPLPSPASSPRSSACSFGCIGRLRDWRQDLPHRRHPGFSSTAFDRLRRRVRLPRRHVRAERCYGEDHRTRAETVDSAGCEYSREDDEGEGVDCLLACFLVGVLALRLGKVRGVLVEWRGFEHNCRAWNG